MKRLLVVLWLLLSVASIANAQSSGNQPAAKGLIFGQGTLATGLTKPTAGQGICNVNGVLAPCGGTVVSTLTSGTTVNVTSDGTSSIQLEYLILANNVTTINTPAASTMPDGKIIYLAIQQPAGTHYTAAIGCFTPGVGTQVYITNTVAGGTQGYCGGTGVVPSIASTDYAEIDFAFHYRATQPAGSTATLRVMSATQ